MDYWKVLAVAGHHRYLADDYLFAEERFSQTLQWKPDAWTAIKSAVGLACAMFKHQGWQLPEQVPGVDHKTVNKKLSSGKDNWPFVCLV